MFYLDKLFCSDTSSYSSSSYISSSSLFIWLCNALLLVFCEFDSITGSYVSLFISYIAYILSVSARGYGFFNKDSFSFI